MEYEIINSDDTNLTIDNFFVKNNTFSGGPIFFFNSKANNSSGFAIFSNFVFMDNWQQNGNYSNFDTFFIKSNSYLWNFIFENLTFFNNTGS